MFTLVERIEMFWFSFVNKINNFYTDQKYYRINKKKFKKMLKGHRPYDYNGFFEFMDVFLDDQINLEPSHSLNREKLVKKLKVLKELNTRIYEDDYVFSEFDYHEDAESFSEMFTKKKLIVFKNKKSFLKQRKADLDYYAELLGKYILHCWD